MRGVCAHKRGVCAHKERVGTQGAGGTPCLQKPQSKDIQTTGTAGRWCWRNPMPGDQDTGREGFLEEGHEGQGSPEKAAWLRAWPRRHLGSRAAALGLKVSNMLLGKSGEELLIAPERMKRLGQSK